MTKKLKRPVAFLSAFVMVMAMLLYFPGGFFSNIDWGLKASAAETITPTQPTEGDGSTENPYKIGTAEEIYWFAGLVNGTLDDATQNKSANAVLTADITVNEGVLNPDGTLVADVSGFTIWTPIGKDSKNQYTGTFDGQNHTVNGLYFNDTKTEKVGLFGYVGSDGKISNVGVVDSYFNGKMMVGGVCGMNNGTIENCYNEGTVSGTGSGVGGVCGMNYGIIEKCHNTGTVSGTGSYVGGVCGANYSTIENCYNSGTVSGSDYVGGVCGINYSGTIKNCYNEGTVSGNNAVGGVCGYNSGGTIENSYNEGEVNGTGNTSFGGVCGENGGTITNCYNTGNVIGNSNVGGVCGENSGTITNCYYNSDKYSGNAIGEDSGTATDAEGKTTAQFNIGEVAYLLSQGCTVNETTYSGLYWIQPVDEDYPVLSKIGLKQPTSSDSVYQIGTAEELYWFAALVNGDKRVSTEAGEQNKKANAVLTADITVNKGENTGDVANCNGNKAAGWIDWTPIGNSDSNPYTGTFDGQGFTVSGLYFNDTNTSYVGLFGYVGENGSVSNVGVVDSYFKGKSYVGGVCGQNMGTIINCYNTGSVTANGTVTFPNGTVASAGGVCGTNNTGTIANCYNTGKVTTSGTVNSAGGVCGINGGTITNCYYLDTCNAEGTKFTCQDGKSKTTAQFNIGEVAFLLSQGCTIGEGESAVTYDGSVWGQTLTGDNKQDYPVLGGKMVLTNSDQSAFANDIIIYGQSVTLDGTIGMNIYVAADDAFVWTASFNGTEVTIPKKDENGLYKFTYQVAAKDMEQEIVFSINGEEKAKVSVKTYLDTLNTADDTKLANLADAMKTYGTAANAFFKGESVAEVTGIAENAFDDYTFTKGTAPEGITYYGSSLILESETIIRHYFTLADGYNADSFTIGAGNGPGKLVAKQGYYYVDIKNISAEKLGNVFSVSVNGDAVISNYSALSYAKEVLDSEETDDNLKNLVKALYIYNRNAIAYNEPQKEDLK